MSEDRLDALSYDPTQPTPLLRMIGVKSSGASIVFVFFLFFPPVHLGAFSGYARKKKKSNPLDAPDDPSQSYISHESRGRRARSPGDGSRCGHPGCFPGDPELSRSATARPPDRPPPEQFRPRRPSPIPSRTAPLRAALEHGILRQLPDSRFRGLRRTQPKFDDNYIWLTSSSIDCTMPLPRSLS